MKTILAALVLMASVSSFALTSNVTKISCTDHSNSDLQMQIVIDQNKQVQSISLYNIDWSQTPEATIKEILAVGSYNPMQGIDVILKTGETISIDYSILEPRHDGEVRLYSPGLSVADSYYCQ